MDKSEFTGTPQYNGNISGMEWIHNNHTYNGYAFEYDALNRLKEAEHQTFNGSSWKSSNDRYSVKGINYDLNGNILGLTRFGATSLEGANNTQTNGPTFGIIDDLNYFYEGNRLKAVHDRVDNLSQISNDFSELVEKEEEYIYDENGNMIEDGNKGVSITYNYLNLPSSVIEGKTGKTIYWVYDALGTKLIKRVINKSTNQAKALESSTNQAIPQDDVVTKYYIAGFEYTVSSSKNLALEAYYHEEGRVVPAEKGFQYEYALKDHLGNTRVFFTDIDNDLIPEVLQREDYYPFGMTMNGNAYNLKAEGALNQYQYNGNEMNEDLGLNWLDYGFRFYDPSIGRWNVIDLLAETDHSISISPYHYVANNPISNVDLLGLDWYTDADGNYRYDPNLTEDDQSSLKEGQKYFGKNGNITLETDGVIVGVAL